MLTNRLGAGCLAGWWDLSYRATSEAGISQAGSNTSLKARQPLCAQADGFGARQLGAGSSKNAAADSGVGLSSKERTIRLPLLLAAVSTIYWLKRLLKVCMKSASFNHLFCYSLSMNNITVVPGIPPGQLRGPRWPLPSVSPHFICPVPSVQAPSYFSLRRHAG